MNIKVFIKYMDGSIEEKEIHNERELRVIRDTFNNPGSFIKRMEVHFDRT